MTDLKQLAEAVSGTIKAWVAERLKAVEAGLPDLVRKHIADLPKPQNGKDADPLVMAAEIARQVAALPKPADGKSVSEEAVALLVRAEVARLPAPAAGKDADPRLVETLVNATVKEAMAKIRQPADGKSVDGAEVRGMVAAEVAAQVAQLSKPKDGKDADPALIEQAAKAAVAALPAPDLSPLVRTEVQRAVAELPRPKDGEPGKDYDVAVLKAAVALEVRAVVDKLPPALPGKDADQAAIVSQVFDLVMRATPKPKDGTSVTVDDVKPLLEAEVQHWEHEFERRCQDVLERLALRYKGKDGVDGFSLDDLDVELKDGRQLVLRLRGTEREVERAVMLPGLPIYRGIFRSAGKGYESGDMATYGGSLWMAVKQTTEAPKGPADAWRLVVKGAK